MLFTEHDMDVVFEPCRPHPGTQSRQLDRRGLSGGYPRRHPRESGLPWRRYRDLKQPAAGRGSLVVTELAEFSRGTDGAMLQELAPDRTPRRSARRDHDGDPGQSGLPNAASALSGNASVGKTGQTRRQIRDEVVGVFQPHVQPQTGPAGIPGRHGTHTLYHNGNRQAFEAPQLHPNL